MAIKVNTKMTIIIEILCVASIAAISKADHLTHEEDSQFSPPIEGAASTYDAAYVEQNEVSYSAPQNALGVAQQYWQHQAAYGVPLWHGEPFARAVGLPQPVPVEHRTEVVKHVLYPIWRQVPVLVPHPVAVPVPRPYAVRVEVEKPVPYPVVKWKEVIVEKKVPYPVEKLVPYEVEKPYPVPVVKKVFVPVETHVPVPITVLKTVHHGKPFWHKW